jgi:hypothetical protein
MQNRLSWRCVGVSRHMLKGIRSLPQQPRQAFFRQFVLAAQLADLLKHGSSPVHRCGLTLYSNQGRTAR